MKDSTKQELLKKIAESINESAKQQKINTLDVLYLNSILSLKEKIEKEEITDKHLAEYLCQLINNTQSLEHTSPPTTGINRINDPALGLEVFKTYRSMIEHEDNLLNQRLTWFLVTQAFLFAAFGTVLNASITGIFAKRFVLSIVSLVGLANSLATIQPLHIALTRVDELGSDWEKQYQNNSKITRQAIDTLPAPVVSINHKFRHFVRAFPVISGVAWLVLLLFSICSTINEDNSKNQYTQQSQPQIKSGETYVIKETDITKLQEWKNKLNSDDSPFKSEICQTDTRKALIVAPVGHPSFHLPQDLAKVVQDQVNKVHLEFNFSRLTVNQDYLKGCQ